MNAKDKLAGYRQTIDGIDKNLIALFSERMEVARQVAECKVEANMAIEDSAREQVVVDNAVAMVGSEIKAETTLLMRTLMALSRGHQRKEVFKKETPLLPPPREKVTDNIVCAYQGVPGAWGEQAAYQLFPGAERTPVEYFEDVFIAVREKKAAYGVVPIENSQTGAIGETYDLLRKYGCYIVGRTWVDIRQCLYAKEGVGLTDIREVVSHPEGFKQCRSFLKNRSWDLTSCRNTAFAAEIAAAGNGKTAAICSRRAGERCGLALLAPDIMDAADNRTNFVVIASEPEYDEDSNLISITFSTQHRAGSLCESLLPFMAEGINLMRIESRPAGPDKYRFFAEVGGNIADPVIAAALRQASSASEYLEVLGCYKNL